MITQTSHILMTFNDQSILFTCSRGKPRPTSFLSHDRNTNKIKEYCAKETDTKLLNKSIKHKLHIRLLLSETVHICKSLAKVTCIYGHAKNQPPIGAINQNLSNKYSLLQGDSRLCLQICLRRKATLSGQYHINWDGAINENVSSS